MFKYSSVLPPNRRVWDLHTGHCRLTLEGHEGKINDLQVTLLDG